MNTIWVKAFAVIVGFLVVTSNVAASSDGVELIIKRSLHKLYVKKGPDTIRSFDVALGRGGEGKLKQGDLKTPLGQYRISTMRESDRFHLFIQLNYPNMEDATRALRNKVINRAQYRRILDAHVFQQPPPQNTPLGGYIGIHGIGVETKQKLNIHQNIDWTEGCIALRNNEVDELSRLVQVGTPILIVD